MALTPIVNGVFVEPPDGDGWSEYNLRLAQRVGLNLRKINLLDLACGHANSMFVRVYADEFPDTVVFSLDIEPLVLGWLDAPRKICADARRLPFTNNSFDLVWDGYAVFGCGISKNTEAYRVAKEVRRILKPQGALIFNHYSTQDRSETIENLAEIGFKEITHLLRFSRGKPQRDSHIDSYLIR